MNVRLRFWAFCQVVCEIVRAPLQRDSWWDARTLFAQSVIKGHLHTRCFMDLARDFKSLNDPDALASDEWVIQVARMQLVRYVEQEVCSSGYLHAYLHALRAHLDTCATCRESVCEQVRSDVAVTAYIKKLLDDAYGPPPSK